MRISSKKLKIFASILIVLAVLTQGQQTEEPETTLTPIIEDENIATPDLTYTEPIEVARRNLQSTPVTSGTGQTMQSLSITRYSGLILYHEFPQTWTVGQIFQVRGKLTNAAAASGTPVNFVFINTATNLKGIEATVTVPAGGVQFTINVDTRSIPVGDYYLALYPNRSGSYSLSYVYKVRLPGTQTNTIADPPAPSGCAISFVNNKLMLNWNRDTTIPLNKIVFTQGSNTVSYVLSNFVNSFEVPFKDFANFINGTVTVTVASAYSQLNGLSGKMSAFSTNPWIFTFNAGQHAFDEQKSTITLAQPIPWIVPVGTTITIQGSASVTLYSKIVVQEPQNTISYYYISPTLTTIAADTSFSNNITLTKSGVYILEVNANTGAAVLNRPVYVGDFLPLLPDFADLFTPKLTTPVIAISSTELTSMRSTYLNLLNQKRATWGLPSLTLDNDLNNLAQGHSNDMIARNFFGHVNPDGNAVQQRATLAGLNYGVAQNIAMNPDLADAHRRLARSPGHLANIVGPTLSRVGIGITKDARGYLYVTENYAAPLPVPVGTLQSNQIEDLRVSIRNWIVSAHPQAVEDPLLSSHIITWLTTNSTQSIFNHIWYTAKYPLNYLSASTVTGTYSPTMTSLLTPGVHLKQPDSTYINFGIGVIQQADGKAKLQAVYAK